jgi:hypothetical protein
MDVTYMSAHVPVNNVVFEHDYIALILRLHGDVITRTKTIRSGRYRQRLAARIRALGERLFRDDDARALRHGWQIKTQHGGLSRVYRDSRFDQLARCPDCCASGTSRSGSSCHRCSATGRIVLGQDVSSTQGGGGDVA